MLRLRFAVMRMMYGKMMLGVRLKLLPVAQRPVLNSIPKALVLSCDRAIHVLIMLYHSK
jgi:hypothetical protein